MSKRKPTWLDGILGSQLRDTQGEVLSIEGADISVLEASKGLFNDNHGVGTYNVLGRITYAKKIFKAEDCEDDRQRYYWDKIKAPYIYGKGYLFDDEDHPNARAAAAILRSLHKKDCPLQLKASVEGGVIARGISDSRVLARTKIHSAAITFTPANQATLLEPLNMDKSDSSQEDEALIKSVMHLATTNVPSFRHVTRQVQAEKIVNNFQKISALAKKAGFDIPIPTYQKDELIKYAVLEKVKDNIIKINQAIFHYNSLQKISKKQLSQMLPNNAEVVNWVSQNIPREDVATWFVRAYKKDPEIFNDENKQAIQQHLKLSDQLNSKFRLDKSHDFNSGMKALDQNSTSELKRYNQQHRLMEPEGKKIIDLGNGKGWYELNKGSCSKEAAAMGHCGNVASEIPGDSLLSYREEVQGPDGKTYHKPHITVVNNGGYLGESKGYGNEKPSDKQAMAALLSQPDIKGNIGGGFEAHKNFQFDDLSDEDKKKLQHKNLALFESLKPVSGDILNNPRFSQMAKDHNQVVDVLTNNKQPDLNNSAVVKALAQHSKTPKEIIDQLSLDDIADSPQSPNMNKHLFERLWNSPKSSHVIHAISSNHFTPQHMEEAFNNENTQIRASAVSSPHFKAKHYDKAINDPEAQVRYAAVLSNHFKPEHVEQALADKDPWVRRAAVYNKIFPSEKLDQALKDEDVGVRIAAIKSPHFSDAHIEQALNDPSDIARNQAVASNAFKAEHLERALADKSGLVRSAAINSPHAESHHIAQALNDSSRLVQSKAVGSPKFGVEHVKQALAVAKDDPDLHEKIVATPAYQQFKLKSNKFFKNTDASKSLNKALMAGYGGASAPSARVGGAVIQTEQLDTGNKDSKHITCFTCGDKQIYMPYQVKCRNCMKHFPLEDLEKLIT